MNAYDHARVAAPVGAAATTSDNPLHLRLRVAARRVAPMLNTASVVPEEQHFILSSLSPGWAQRRLSLAVVRSLLAAYFITEGLLSTIQLGRVDAFVPAYATAMFVTDSITAVLLFAQFSILRSRALLAISSGYLFTALMVIPWMLTFPGVFTASGLLGAGLQSTSCGATIRNADLAGALHQYEWGGPASRAELERRRLHAQRDRARSAHGRLIREKQ